MKVPEPRQSKRRPSAASRVFLWTFLLLVVAGAIGGEAAVLAPTCPDQGPLAEDEVFIVEQGLSVPQIGESLEKAGIISNARIFSAMASVTGTHPGSRPANMLSSPSPRCRT